MLLADSGDGTFRFSVRASRVSGPWCPAGPSLPRLTTGLQAYEPEGVATLGPADQGRYE